MKKSFVYCGHANENPHKCPCDDDCICKDYTCKTGSKWSGWQPYNQNKKHTENPAKQGAAENINVDKLEKHLERKGVFSKEKVKYENAVITIDGQPSVTAQKILESFKDSAKISIKANKIRNRIFQNGMNITVEQVEAVLRELKKDE